MAKSLEELNSLKEKFDALKEELSGLSEEELNHVTGGDDSAEDKNVKCPRCGGENWRREMYAYVCTNCGYKINL